MTPPLRLMGPDHQVVQDLDAWAASARPAKPDEWKPLGTAYELARLWLSDAGLVALRGVLDLLPATSGFTPQQGIAEAQTKFDGYDGPHKHDLLLTGDAAGGRTVVAIDGRVNEGFGQTLDDYDKAARRTSSRGDSTNAAERLDKMTQALGGWFLPDDDEDEDGLRSLRIELFTGLAGTIAAAGDEDAVQAVFCVHELVTPMSSVAARTRNDADLRKFARAIAPQAQILGADDAWIAGPGTVAQRTIRLPSSVAFHIARVTSPMI